MIIKPKLFADGDVIVHVHVCTHNEEPMIRHFINHYQQFTKNENIFVHDQHSTDNTVEIAKSLGCTVNTWGGDSIDDDDLLNQKHQSYYSSTNCDFVIIVDCDEFVMHSNLLDNLNRCKRNGIKVPRMTGHNMFYENFDYINDDISFVKYGEGNNAANAKSCIIKSNEIIQYAIGCHQLYSPIQEYYEDDEIIKFCHMKWLNFDYIVNRQHYFYSRLSKKNKEMQWGIHYTWDTQKWFNYYNELKNTCIKIFD